MKIKYTIGLALLACLGFSLFFSQVKAQALSGTKTIGGAGATYATIAAAVTDLKTKGVGGAVVFKIRNGTYNERVNIPLIIGTSELRDVTFESESGNAADVIITSIGGAVHFDHGTITLNGASYMNFRKLTINNTSQTYASAFHIRRKAQKVKIENCVINISSSENQGVSAGIAVSDSAACPNSIISAVTIPVADYIEVRGCTINGGGYGMLVASQNVFGENTIENNVFNNTALSAIYLANTDLNIVAGNTINMSPDGISQHGIYLSDVPSIKVERNYIKNADLHGIYYLSGNNGIVANNILGGGFRRTSTVGYGIYVTAYGVKFYNNSVLYDAASGTSAGLLSAVVYVGGSSLTFINNNFLNLGGGYIYYVGTDKEQFAQADYNNLFCTGPAISTFVSGTQKDADLAAHKKYTGMEQHSVSLNAKFSALLDLHLAIDNINRMLDGGGTPLAAVKTDFDGQPRDTVAPDIGADEIVLTYPDYEIALTDIQPGVLTKEPVNFTVRLVNLGSKSLKDSVISLAFSTDGGITWSAPEQVQIKGLSAVNHFEHYTFQNSAMFSTPGNYSVCVKIHSAGLIPDINTINNKVCESVCLGIDKPLFTIGATGSDFTKIKDAVDMLANLPCGIVTPVVFNIKPGTYTEQISIPLITGVSEKNTITFQSQSGNPADVTITFNNNSQAPYHTILLDGARYVKLKNLTVINTNNLSSKTIHLENDASFNLIQGCVVKADTTYAGISANGGMNAVYLSGNCNDNVVDSSQVYGGFYAVVFAGGNRNVLRKCVVKGSITAPVSISGNYLTISDNVFTGTGMYGFYAGSNYRSVITRNKVYACVGVLNETSSTVYYGFYGSFSSCEISNNMIITGDGNRIIQNGYGMYLTSNYGNKIYYNSVITNFKQVAGVTYAFYTETSTASIKTVMKNNIFMNNNGGVAIYADATSTALSDYNDLYTTGPNIATWNDANYSTLAAYRAGTGMDQNSVDVNPGFLSIVNDLHTLAPVLDKKGIPLPEITTDIDGLPRDLLVPDIGADEFVLDFYDFAIIDIEPKIARFGENTIRVTIRNNALKSLKDSTVSLSYSTDSGATWSTPETFKAAQLLELGNTEEFSFAAKWNVSAYQTYNLMVRINPPGLFSDKFKLNDIHGTVACVILEGGTYEVGALAPVFKSLKQVTDVLNAGCGIEGPVVFDIDDGTYEEQLLLEKIIGASAINTVTIQSKSGQASGVVIKAAPNDKEEHYTVRLKGSKYVRLKNVRVENTGAEFASGINITAGAEHILVEGCDIVMNSDPQTETHLGILVNGNKDVYEPGSVSKLSLIGNTVTGGYTGIKLLGNSVKAGNELVINNNRIYSTKTYGIFSTDANLESVQGNEVVLADNPVFSVGMILYNSTSNAKVDGNKVLNGGIYISNVKGVEQAVISNNMLGGESKNAGLADGLVLEYVENTGIYYNSINYNNTGSGPNPSVSLRVKDGKKLDIRNNIIANAGTGYAYYVENTSSILHSDYNDLYTGGSKLVYWNGDKANLAALQSASGRDINSISIAPQFNTSTDFHTFQAGLDGKALSIPAVQHDFDGQPRSSSPDIGCDEFTNGTDGSLNTWLSPDPGDKFEPGVTKSLRVQLGNPGNTVISNFPVSYTINGEPAVTETYSGTINAGQSADFEFSSSWTPENEGTFTLCASADVPNDSYTLNNQFCITVTAKTFVGVGEQKEIGWKIYPNPAGNTLFIQFDERFTKGNTQLSIFNNIGQVVKQAEAYQATPTELDVAELPEGMYILKASLEEHIFYTKFLITR